MKRLVLFGALIALVVGLVAFAIWRHHVTGPRFEVQVRPRAAVMSKSECRAVARNAGFGPHGLSAPRLCFGAGSAASFVVTVTNTGGRGGWVLSCVIHTIGRSGQFFHATHISEILSAGAEEAPDVTHLAPAARYLAPGESASYDWFVAGVEPERVARYTGTCTYKESLSGPF